MSNRYGDEWTASLLDPERRLSGLTPSELLREAGLRPGMTVVDFGCGPGLITLHAAESVGPNGRVYALDIHEGMVSLVESRASDAGFANVTALLNDGPEAPLPDGVADHIFCTLVFHYRESREERQALALDLARLLKPGGALMVVQWVDRVPPDETLDLFESAGLTSGLTSGRPSSAVNRQYRMTATKPRIP